jgi:hypothetical protein
MGSIAGVCHVVNHWLVALLVSRMTQNCKRSRASRGTSNRGRDATHSVRKLGGTGMMHGRVHGLLVVQVNDERDGA